MTSKPRTIYFTTAPRYRYGAYEDGAIERASYTKQDDHPEGSGVGLSPTRVTYRVLGDGHEWARWRVSCRTPAALLSTDDRWRVSCRTQDEDAGRVIGDGSDGAMNAWLDADPALRGTK
ncbi:MAG: hypothetical protein H0U59_13135 [Gemmatimonadaceae bacterium]|nr:hypothetical protein [Gemmatimonadaceae bacterium]